MKAHKYIISCQKTNIRHKKYLLVRGEKNFEILYKKETLN